MTINKQQYPCKTHRATTYIYDNNHSIYVLLLILTTYILGAAWPIFWGPTLIFWYFSHQKVGNGIILVGYNLVYKDIRSCTWSYGVIMEGLWSKVGSSLYNEWKIWEVIQFVTYALHFILNKPLGSREKIISNQNNAT